MTGVVGRVDAPELHVMTYNIRRRLGIDPRPADRWSRRQEPLRLLLAAESPTVLGVQEAMPDQAAFIAATLGPRYRSIGRGRNRDGRGEACPLFYDADRLELIEAEQTALSAQPAEPGSRSWGSVVPRIVVSALFRDRATDARFGVMNTHFDPFSAAARVRSSEIVRGAASEATEPVIVMGDLNAAASSPALRVLLSGGVLRDAWANARTHLTPGWGTFVNYRRPRADAPRIDWIVVTEDVRVLRAAIDGEPVDGRWPSDHLPVHAVVRVDEDGADR